MLALKHQLVVAQFLQVIIFGALILSMLFYLNTRYQFEIGSVVKKKILGLSLYRVYGIYTLPLIIVMFIAYAINILLGRVGLPTLILISGLMVIIMTTFILDRKISPNYIQIIKGDNV